MYFFYSLLFGAWVFFMAPFFLYKAWRHQKYLPALLQRLGFLPETLKSVGPSPTFWIHSCSVGETLSVVPLAAALQQRFPEARLVFSTITKTGQAIASERFALYGSGNTFYFPIDLATIANRVLDWVRPTLLITIDTEIWPNVLHEAHRRNIPVVLCNGRISAESFRYYRWAQFALGRIFQNYSLLLMKSPEDAQRIQRMGAPPSKVQISGNLKYDRGAAEQHATDAQARALNDAFSLSALSAPIIVAGSTHEGEEHLLLTTLRRVRLTPGLENTRLLLVPRHPERFTPVAQLVAHAGFRMQRRSETAPPAPNKGGAKGAVRPSPSLLPMIGPQSSEIGAGNRAGGPPTPSLSGPGEPPDVFLLDTLGELTVAYRFATVAFVGGTLIPHGGQSIMEPALHGKAIVVGPSMKNFPGIIDDFRDANAIVQITATETDKDAQISQLTDAFTRLLQDEAERERMGTAARAIFQASQGATQFTVDRIAALVEEALAP